MDSRVFCSLPLFLTSRHKTATGGAHQFPECEVYKGAVTLHIVSSLSMKITSKVPAIHVIHFTFKC